MNEASRVRILHVETLADDWAVLKKTTFDYLRSDGTWQRQSRETYDRGHGATLLLYNLTRRTVILTRQFRFPVYVADHHGLLIETPAGLLDAATPEDRVRQEVEEETGYRVQQVQKLFECYMSPGSVTEQLAFFIAAYDPTDRIHRGGGVEAEGEDLEVLELPFEQATAMIGRDIIDAKTIMLLQYAQLHVF